MEPANAVTMNESALQSQISFMKSLLDERQYRMYLGKTAIELGRGGQAVVQRLSGASINTVRKGVSEVKLELSVQGNGGTEKSRVRKAGGGRKAATVKYSNLDDCIEKIIDKDTFGDPERILHWTTAGLMDIAKALQEEYQISVSHTVVAQRLNALGYSKQLNQKMLQTGKPHPDRNAQFEYINSTSKKYIDEGVPVISIDCKKKENLGNFKNNGQEYRKKGDPRKTYDHDFLIKELGSVAPYGIYDIDKNTGFINLGTSHDTSEFAVNSLYQWWLHIGQATYPKANRLYINCDGGGSNGSRVHLWKTQLAEFCVKTGLTVHVSHFPPGTSKWNKIEHRLFCFISKNWQGQPLIDIPTVVKLIGSTKTTAGLEVKCIVDENEYKTGIKVSEELYDSVAIERIEPMPNWNYIITGFKG